MNTLRSLIDKYGYWGEHPEVSVEDWKYEVENNDTRAGYWETVLRKLEESAEETRSQL